MIGNGSPVGHQDMPCSGTWEDLARLQGAENPQMVGQLIEQDAKVSIVNARVSCLENELQDIKRRLTVTWIAVTIGIGYLLTPTFNSLWGKIFE